MRVAWSGGVRRTLDQLQSRGLIGQTLARKYRVDSVLGDGAMGVVYSVTHLTLGQRVALKVLRPDFSRDAVFVSRFLREAKAMAQIKSPHVAHVYDVDRLEDGTPYIVMERLEGSDLAAVLRAEGHLPIVDVVTWAIEVCDAIGTAHAGGIIHRDLKPENIFLAESESGARTVKVVDFGISKQLGATTTIDPGSWVGSPIYISPEQLQSTRDIDGRADLWSLGVTLFELLTAEWPFASGSLPALSLAVLHQPPTRLRERRPEAPESLERIITRCLEKDPARRFATANELAGALREVLAPAPPPPSSNPPPLPRHRTSWFVLAGVGAAAALALAALGAPLLDRRDAGGPTANPPTPTLGTTTGGPLPEPPREPAAAPSSGAEAPPSPSPSPSASVVSVFVIPGSQRPPPPRPTAIGGRPKTVEASAPTSTPNHLPAPPDDRK
jgi:eukaryotic-like serine/threonine-protein kinase